MEHDDSHHFKAIFIAGFILVLAGIVLVVELIRGFDMPDNVVRETILAPFTHNEQAQPSESELATIGQNYIKDHATYIMGQNRPILLQSIAQNGGVWTARYEVEQEVRGSMQVYYYTLEIREGRVVAANVSASDPNRFILVTNPQPEEVFSSQDFVVKGQVFPSAERGIPENLDITLVAIETGEFIAEFSARVIPSSENSYVARFTREDDFVGRAFLIVSYGSDRTIVPIVLSQITDLEKEEN